jgi:hypothetical protein
MTDEKFCRDCRHILISDSGIAFARCGKAPMRTSRVTGEPVYPYCEEPRSSLEPDACGPDGALWDAKL